MDESSEHSSEHWADRIARLEAELKHAKEEKQRTWSLYREYERTQAHIQELRSGLKRIAQAAPDTAVWVLQEIANQSLEGEI